MNRDEISSVAATVKKCQERISQIGTPLNNETTLSEPLTDAVQHLGKAHASLLKVITILEKQ